MDNLKRLTKIKKDAELKIRAVKQKSIFIAMMDRTHFYCHEMQ